MYKVAGWVPVAEKARATGGVPIWDVVARYFRGQRTIAPRRPNVPEFIGVAPNPGIT